MNDQVSDFDVLKLKRKTARTQATKTIKTVTDQLAQVDQENRDDVEMHITKLKRIHSQLADLDQQVADKGSFTEADLVTEIERQMQYSDSLHDAIDRLEVKLRKVQNILEQSQSQTHPEQKSKEEFWDDFTCSVDSRTDLSTIDKFKLLKQSLKGEAMSLADGYFLTQRNYQEVKDALQDRFGDPQVAIFVHFEALLELDPASHEVEQLIRIRDKGEAHIRSLTALGLSEDTYALVFAPIILSKLPRFVKMEMHRRNGSQRWTLAALREHLKEEIRVRTKSDRTFANSSADGSSSSLAKASKSSKKQNRTTSVLHVQGGKGEGKCQGSSKPKPFASKPKPRACVFCQANHQPWECSEFPTAESRLPKVQGRCYVCLSDKHLKKSCKSTKSCYYCKKPGHHSSLCCIQFGKPQRPDSIDSSDQSGLVQASLDPIAPEFVPMGTVHAVQTQGIRESKRTGQAILESAEVQVSGLKGSTRARVIFDNGSTLSFIRSDLVKRIGAKCMGQYQTQLSRFGDSRREDKTYPLVQVGIHLRDGSKLLISLRQVKSVSASMRLVPLSLESFSPMFDISEFAGLVDKPLTTEEDILLGLDYYYDIVGPEVWRSNGVVIKQTAVGKIVTGFHHESMTENHRLTDFQMLAVASPKISQDLYNLERFWDIEEVGVIDRTDRSDDETAVELFNESIRFVKGRYEVKWPFKQDPPNLPVNYDVALRRLVSVHRKLLSNSNLLSTYHQIFLDQLAKGVIEEAPVKPEGPVLYLPHHAVVIPTRETAKVRLVFDASSKPNSQFQSLNESMYRGPVFLNDLFEMLLRFRCPAYAVTSDVEKAFLQISLNHSHRDCTRFLWLRDPTESTNAGNLIVYRYARVLFGATASPFLLAATIIHHMKIANTKISNRIIDSTYMDNIISGHNTTAGLFQYYQEARQLVQPMCMNLHQWYSNNSEFMSRIHPEERGTREVPSVLGLKWNISSDTVACTVSKSSVEKVTKRNVLKCIASVYDPCGWYSAATISGKILMQKVWEAKIGWDQELLEPLRKEWYNVSNSLSGLSSHSISRQYSWPAEVQEESRFDLHCFCDASTKAYCAAVYHRAECSVGVFCDLVFAKSRVAPLKKLTIPKLELEAVKMGKRLLGFVERYLRLSIALKTLWTDSFCTLCWIESDKVVTVFVRNRVQEIRSDQDLQFRFVPSESNPWT